MSEEIPPSSLTVRPHAEPPAGRDTANMLRLTAARWLEISPRGASPQLVKPATMVIGAWLVMAWNRFGFQGLSAPRAATRFVLVGIYGWLGLALMVLAGGLARSRLDDQRHGSVPNPARVLQVTGLAHQTLLVTGFLLQVFSAVPIPGVAPAVVFAAFLLWLPAVLAAATRAVLGRGRSVMSATAVALAAYLAWLLLVGRFLLAQLGHLI